MSSSSCMTPSSKPNALIIDLSLEAGEEKASANLEWTYLSNLHIMNGSILL